MTRVLIAGVSTRAAAESAARAGYSVTAFDAFGDLDHHASVRVVSLPRDLRVAFTASAAARAAKQVDCDAAAYLSNFENHPRAVSSLAAGRALWGNGPDVLRRVRDPRLLTAALQARGVRAPRVALDVAGTSAAPDAIWLVKPLRSGGGRNIKIWRGSAVPRGCVLQEFVEGTPASLVFVAARGRCVPLGFSVQLIGRREYGADAFRYCGNVVVNAREPRVSDAAVAMALRAAEAVSEEFALVGVNGIDLVVRNGLAHVVEVNPRWSASMELVERAYGVSVFAAHAAACANGSLPDFNLLDARKKQDTVYGKAVVFARHNIVITDLTSWCDDDTVRDVPQCGIAIDRGEPICTVFAEGTDLARCEAALTVRAAAVYSDVDARVPQPS